MSSLERSSEIFVGVPCVATTYPETILGLVQLAQHPNYAGFGLVEAALLPFSRNGCLQLAYDKYVSFTHFLFVDADMSDFTSAHLDKLLKADKPIISALATTRKPPYTIVNPLPQARTDTELIHIIQQKAIVETRHTGMAFTLIKREVLDALREDTPKGPIWFNTDRLPRPTFSQEVQTFIGDKKSFTREDILKAVTMGQQSHLNTPTVGEDIGFCEKAIEKGFKIYVDCGLPIGHLGVRACGLNDIFGRYVDNLSSDVHYSRLSANE